MPASGQAKEGDELALFTCPNPDCDRFNQETEFDQEDFGLFRRCFSGRNRCPVWRERPLAMVE